VGRIRFLRDDRERPVRLVRDEVDAVAVLDVVRTVRALVDPPAGFADQRPDPFGGCVDVDRAFDGVLVHDSSVG
jgi:hypothetical protein